MVFEDLGSGKRLHTRSSPIFMPWNPRGEALTIRGNVGDSPKLKPPYANCWRRGWFIYAKLWNRRNRAYAAFFYFKRVSNTAQN
ncbi:hypothetical protein B9Q13_00690 [Candidatus Marsarchaeota G2 archaeon ECH_B_SAG-G16]|uniref:Uncharacterized protein n=2 Tax=Candidatus Marsarchaeota group 2 TaxID=2203771 RepID=A0A2R6C4R1_9ARCH|nr:MAG: hypothetical protein B9Q13_00690 [Candidatus Marsarchaeota G2 archaeon ECH_B_SAG-G16]